MNVEVETHAGILEVDVDLDPAMRKQWIVYCKDTFDGAPDAGHCSGNVVTSAGTKETAIEQWVEEFNELWLDENTTICGTCMGSGEGFMPESRCTSCAGAGEISPLPPNEDERY